MASALDDDEILNDDYYSLLNVRREVQCAVVLWVDVRAEGARVAARPGRFPHGWYSTRSPEQSHVALASELAVTLDIDFCAGNFYQGGGTT